MIDLTRWPWWPYAVGGFFAPIGAAVVAHWWPMPVASAVFFFVAFLLVSLWIRRSRPNGRCVTLPRALASSAAGAGVVGLLQYLMRR